VILKEVVSALLVFPPWNVPRVHRVLVQESGAYELASRLK
jgi:hypothetical protein